MFLKRGKKGTPENYRPVSLTSVSIEITEQTFLENMLRHMKNKEVAGGSQHVSLRAHRACNI